MIFPVFEERLEELRRDLRADAYGSDLPDVASGMQKTLQGLARRFGLDNTKTECPSSVIDRWNDTILKGLEIKLSQREIRLLSRSPKIGLSNQFINHLASKPAAPAASVIRGLLASFVDTWEQSARDPKLAETINTWVNSPNVAQLLKWWRDHPEYWLHSEAHQAIARIIIAERLVAEEVAKRFHLPQGSSLLRLSLSDATSSIAHNIDKAGAGEIDFLLTKLFVEPLIGKECLDSALTAIVTSRMATDSEPFRKQLVNLVLLHPRFGDPRIQLHNWGNDLQQAKEIVLGWLSAEDIRTFFEIILSDEDDEHGRKNFWLGYERRIKLSRVFVSNKDRRNCYAQLEELAEKGRQFGEAEGDTSIFVLDLGSVVAAEFSKAGNALYLYEKANFQKVMRNFFAPSAHHKALKSQKWAIEPPLRINSAGYYPKHRVFRGFRHIDGWQYTVRDVLAKSKYGILPSN
jgi:hypothetical protein